MLKSEIEYLKIFGFPRMWQATLRLGGWRFSTPVTCLQHTDWEALPYLVQSESWYDHKEWDIFLSFMFS